MSHRLSGPADLTMVEEVHGLLAGLWAGAADVPEAIRMRFSIAIAEVVANIVEHARAPDGGPAQMTIGLVASAEELVATIEDDGPEFVPPPDRAVDPMAESGRGLQLVRDTADVFTYERVGEENRWRISVGRRASTGS